jgi:RNA polymerase-binding protein DksA
LRTELTKQRTILLATPHLSLVVAKETETESDPLDQASVELGQSLAIQERTRIFDRLRRIERALQLMRTDHYGRCHHCHEEIPYRRLMVKPDTLYCVPCLTLIEQEAATN